MREAEIAAMEGRMTFTKAKGSVLQIANKLEARREDEVAWGYGKATESRV